MRRPAPRKARPHRSGGSAVAYRQAACDYYDACTFIVAYADQVMARAVAYGFQGGQATPPDAAAELVDQPSADAAGTCAPDGLGDTGVPGKVKIAPDANFPGQPIQPVTIRFLEQIAGIADRELVVTTGTCHSVSTVNGNRSDHADGYPADLGMLANGGSDDSPVGDQIMAACLIAAGMLRDRAIQLARQGGLFTLVHNGLRIQPTRVATTTTTSTPLPDPRPSPSRSPARRTPRRPPHPRDVKNV